MILLYFNLGLIRFVERVKMVLIDLFGGFIVFDDGFICWWF
jgi:hypothetical protein